MTGRRHDERRPPGSRDCLRHVDFIGPDDNVAGRADRPVDINFVKAGQLTAPLEFSGPVRASSLAPMLPAVTEVAGHLRGVERAERDHVCGHSDADGNRVDAGRWAGRRRAAAGCRESRGDRPGAERDRVERIIERVISASQ